LDNLGLNINDILQSKFDDLFSDFHSWFDIIGYYQSRIRIGPIISMAKVPDHILAYFDEAKDTFAFMQYRSTIALSRALLEMVLFDKLKGKRAFSNTDPKVTDINVAREDNLCRYINLAKFHKLLTQSEGDIAHKVREQANSILHNKTSKSKPNELETLEIVLDTMKLVEKLYR